MHITRTNFKTDKPKITNKKKKNKKQKIKPKKNRKHQIPIQNTKYFNYI